MALPADIARLIQTFDQNKESYLQPRYNETQLRREFVDPFFKALGWDVDNTKGWAEAYKEVIHEDAIRIGSATKAPDYCFRIGGSRKFFVEAKKPSVDLKDNPEPAYQLRRYAWSAKLGLSILTDFQEFAVYDCRVRPNKADRASKARVMYLQYTDYSQRWHEIASIFARDAVLKGSFDKYAQTEKRKRGTAEVDAAFLAEISDWREKLARNIALRNAALTNRQLNYAVQMTIDRIVFLRICEDRGIETYGQLMTLLNGPDTYQRLMALCRKADDRYNSGLFHFSPEKGRHEPPDELTPELIIDDKPLKEILRCLYYPDSPYEFSVLPAEILGHVYEQFLGKVITLTAGHHARVEDKAEVKKAGGVYYTPAYIVDYIVTNTVGKLLQNRSVRCFKTRAPRLDRPLRVLDPACGSGSFLLGAYEQLLNWYRDYYEQNDPDKLAAAKHPPIYQSGRLGWKLTTAERKRILLDHIYGVDIDPQAVEVTKLSLLLKVLEGEKELVLFHKERALPDLSNNIRCGNSLIGPDFYHDRQLNMFDEEERLRINAFDWHGEFPDVFPDLKAGFDAVIGNPPYVLLQDEFRDDEQLQYFRSRYSVASYKLDTYHLFMERAISLTKPKGWYSMITPANFLTNNYLNSLRKFLLNRCLIDHILVVDGGIFHGVSVDNAIVVVSPGQETTRDFNIKHVRIEVGGLVTTSVTLVSPERSLNNKYVLFTGTSGWGLADLCDRVFDECTRLGELAHVNFGKQLRNRKQYTHDVIEVQTVKQIQRGYKPCYTGRDVGRYHVSWNHLACLDDEAARCGGCWDPSRQNATNKILTRQIGKCPEYALDERGYQCLNTMFMINVHKRAIDPRYLLGVLNSTLLRAIWTDRFYDQRRTFPKIKGTYLEQLPIHMPDLSDKEQAARHNRTVSLVQSILDLYKQLASAKTGHDKTVLERQISAADRQIDQLVYKLYGLTEDEIAIVENSTKNR